MTIMYIIMTQHEEGTKVNVNAVKSAMILRLEPHSSGWVDATSDHKQGENKHVDAVLSHAW